VERSKSSSRSTCVNAVERGGTVWNRSLNAGATCGTKWNGTDFGPFHQGGTRRLWNALHNRRVPPGATAQLVVTVPPDQENMFRPKYNLMMLNLVVNDLYDIIIERPHYDWWCSCDTNSSNSWATWVRFLGSWSHYGSIH
jgi:hypothetical protein